VQPIIELNDEVQVTVKVKAKHPIAAGQEVTLADFDADNCCIIGPEYEGRPAAYFLMQAAFSNVFVFFDFTPNAIDFVLGGEMPKMPYRSVTLSLREAL